MKSSRFVKLGKGFRHAFKTESWRWHHNTRATLIYKTREGSQECLQNGGSPRVMTNTGQHASIPTGAWARVLHPLETVEEVLVQGVVLEGDDHDGAEVPPLRLALEVELRLQLLLPHPEGGRRAAGGLRGRPGHPRPRLTTGPNTPSVHLTTKSSFPVAEHCYASVAIV